MIRPAQTAPGSLRVDEVNEIEVLGSYRLLWNSLLPRTRRVSFFHSLDWLVSYWRHFGGDQRLRILIVSARGKPVGILPLVVRRERTRLGLVRVLGYPLHDWGMFYGPIGPNATATLMGGLRHIRNTRRDWDLLDLRWVDADGCDRGRTANAMRMAGFHAHKQVWDQTGVVEMECTWEQYWAKRRKKWRHHVTRCLRRLSEEGEVTHLRYRPDGAAAGDGDPRWDLYDACEDLAGRGWQATSTNGTTRCHDSVGPFLRDVHAAAARTGSLDLNILLLDGRPISFIHNYHCNGRVHGVRMGHDPAVKRLGPGCVLQRMILEDSFRRGDEVFDWGVGLAQRNRYWQTSTASSYRYIHYPLTAPRSQLLRMKHWLADRLAGVEAAT